MNLRFDGNSVRFRMSVGEFETLRSCGVVEEKTRLSQELALTYRVEYNPQATDHGSEKLTLRLNDMQLTATITDAGLETLSSAAFKKSGLAASVCITPGHQIDCAVQVDFHTKRR